VPGGPGVTVMEANGGRAAAGGLAARLVPGSAAGGGSESAARLGDRSSPGAGGRTGLADRLC
jgi:hypothetical protein